VGELRFQAPNLEQFPCLRLGYEAVREGGTATAILNAGNEIAVQAFLDERIRFTDIPGVLEHTLERCSARDASALSIVLEDDTAARSAAVDYVESLTVARA
jgi:1-deoxy-D-xylulose-5-phosphate reductoisomerase